MQVRVQPSPPLLVFDSVLTSIVGSVLCGHLRLLQIHQVLLHAISLCINQRERQLRRQVAAGHRVVFLEVTLQRRGD